MIFQMGVAFIAGLAGGFISSCPIGPINLWVIGVRLNSQSHGLPAFLSGVIVADLLFAAGAVAGVVHFFQEGTLADLLGLAGGVVLIALALSLFRSRARTDAPAATALTPAASASGYFLPGFIMCAGNPGFPIFWVFAVGAIRELVPAAMTFPAVLLFLLGVSVGDVLWFYLLGELARPGRFFKPSRDIKWIHWLVSGVMGGAGLVSVWRSLSGFIRQ